MRAHYDQICRSPALVDLPSAGLLLSDAALPDSLFHADGDVYQFGVFLGRSLRELVRIFEGVGARTMVRAVWGFDTFTGMPDSANDDREATLASEWGTGRYSASDKDILYDRLRRWANASSLPVSFVRGEYRHTLTPTLAAERGMRPASYIDIDCDTYPSSFAALDWMLSSNLVVPGTVIGYDDFWVLPCAFQDTDVLRYGQAKAHLQLAKNTQRRRLLRPDAVSFRRPLPRHDLQRRIH